MIGKQIADLRKEHGLSQIELANHIGISRSALSLYEIEKREPDGETLNRIADYFHVSTDYLYGRIDKTAETIEFESKYRSDNAHSLSEVDFLNNAGKIIFEQLSAQGPSNEGWDTEEMANYFQIDKHVLEDIFSGNLWPPFEFLETVSLLCEVSTDYLLGLTTNKRSTLSNGQCPFRFNPLSRKRLNRCMEEYEKDRNMWSSTLGISNTELYLLQEYGFIFHLQIIEILCSTLRVSSEYLLGRTDEVGNKMILAFANLDEDNKDIIIGKAKELLKEQRYESSVAADEKYLDSQGKSLPSSGTEGGTMAV